ncbi:pentatricopeptide repeat-containing protein At1g63130, mitochondrial-like [Punica granatum]|uniref:Pentatricopeptide repeat-containing protein At1g63130, mitochondrial-like n=1 Tax=Punica granatum TaxID=22663 RepID=A0A6P8EAJ5_PUNGR|nr:pentatricopeptide repeat-containing protein At1g63130, mitochondrial-like [Punica granatum]
MKKLMILRQLRLCHHVIPMQILLPKHICLFFLDRNFGDAVTIHLAKEADRQFLNAVRCKCRTGGMSPYRDAISLIERMDRVGIDFNICSLSILINCLCQLKSEDLGFSVLGRILKLGFDPDLITSNTLVIGLCSSA